MNKYFHGVIILFLVNIYGCNHTAISKSTPTTVSDNQLLKLILTRNYSDGGFTVVSAQTSVDFFLDAKEFILDKLKESNVPVPTEVLTKLVNTFIQKNAQVVPLTLESEPEKGYLIDYDGKFKKYFEGNQSGGWGQWYKENPRAHCSTQVSLPTYNEEHKLMLVYLGQQCDWLMGSGHIVLLKYEDNKLQELRSVMLWVS